MECRENTELLPRYAAGELDAESRVRFERHTEACAPCRGAAERQRAVWEVLDVWEAPAVSPDFDRRLALRIERDLSWWERFVESMRPALIRRGLPIAAAAGLAVTAAVFLDRSPNARAPEATAVQMQPIRADQQEAVVEDMQMLQEFNGLAHPDSADSKL